jgi:toxin ParE1/3/4
VNFWLHPAAALEHKNQVAHYEGAQAGLGRRYHSKFIEVALQVCANPVRFRVVAPPDIRRAMFDLFPFDVIYREIDGSVQILAVPHHRRQPGYWTSRL